MVIYGVLIVGALAMVVPFLWMVSTSLKSPDEIKIFPPQWIPEVIRWDNYVNAWNSAPFNWYFFNSFFIAIVSTLLELVTTAMAAYAFAKMEFFGKRVLFLTLLGTLMIPGEMLLIPNYITINSLGWMDTYYALIVPWIVSVFGIFLLRQFFMSLPDELWDAAQMDGCSRFRFLWQILIPLSKSGLLTVGLFKFIGSWNAFLWVIIMTNSAEMRTLPVGLRNFTQEAGSLFELLMAASTIAIVPILIIFFLMQKQFIEGIARSGIR
jgi:multiple sugar transport system permease protein